jgi:spore maturation protein CgeB
LPKSYCLEQYDLLLSSHPEFVKNWNLKGYKSELFKPFYDSEKIKYVPWKDRNHDLVFLGSNSKDHAVRLLQLEEISKYHKIEIYGSGFEKVDQIYNLKKYLKGEIWGDDVYNLYQLTKIAFNSHIDLAQGFSANVRMIEAAGSGAVLLTERTDNLNQYFRDDEAISYSSIPEAIEAIDYLKKNELDASKIARKGQIRVEKSHTSQNRVSEFKDLILDL